MKSDARFITLLLIHSTKIEIRENIAYDENMNQKSAIAAINEMGVLLVFPMNNAKEPASLWSYFYPRSEMVWEWDEGGDDRVAKLWHLREQLSSSGKVVYTKWFQGRATFISKKLFTALLSFQVNTEDYRHGLSAEARELLSILEIESPISTKTLKKMSGLTGKQNESKYERVLKELWSRLLIVAYGEVDEGAFPSLAIGATRSIFEELWVEAQKLSSKEAFQIVNTYLAPRSKFQGFFVKSQTRNQPKAEKKISHSISFEDLNRKTR